MSPGCSPTGPGPLPTGRRAARRSFAEVAADQRDLALGQVPGADLEPHGHALQLPVGGPPAEAGVDPVVELGPHAGALELVTSSAASPAPSSSLDQHTTDLDRASRGGTRSPASSPWAMIRPPTIRVETPHDVVQHGCWWPVGVEVGDVEGLGEVLAELVAGAHLQRLAVAHHRLAR